ncbi:MAG: hypothetical protein ACRC10_02220 [Thermoguttaceae bacterium]
MSRLFLITLLVLLPIWSGCSTVSPGNSVRSLFTEENAKTPARMVGFWNCYSQTMPDDVPYRGIGGRILFYGDSKSKEPIKIDGEVTICLFDANDPLPELSKPLKQAIFKPETLTLHYRKDDNGFHGYEFFVPVDPIDGEEKTVLVLVKYVDEKKKDQIRSTPTDVTLVGRPRKNRPLEQYSPQNIMQAGFTQSAQPVQSAQPNTNSYGIQQVGFQERAEMGDFSSETRKRQTESIPLPSSYVRAWQYEAKKSADPSKNSATAQSESSNRKPLGETAEGERNDPRSQRQGSRWLDESGNNPDPAQNVPGVNNSGDPTSGVQSGFPNDMRSAPQRTLALQSRIERIQGRPFTSSPYAPSSPSSFSPSSTPSQTLQASSRFPGLNREVLDRNQQAGVDQRQSAELGVRYESPQSQVPFGGPSQQAASFLPSQPSRLESGFPLPTQVVYGPAPSQH